MSKPRPTKEQTQDRILAKAQELFRVYGFSKTTVADIAAELRMSPANVYKFFPAKSTIVEGCAKRGLDAIRQEVASIVESRGSAMNRIERVVLAIYNFNRRMLRNERQIFKLVATAIDEAWSCIDDFRAFLQETMTCLVRDGIRAHEFAPGSPPRIAALLLDCLHAPLRAHLHPDYAPGENHEKRIRAQIRFLAKALQCQK